MEVSPVPEDASALASAGMEAVSRSERLALMAASGNGSPRFPDGSLKPAVLTSDAQQNWTLCTEHHHYPSVDMAGRPATPGMCKGCYDRERSPEVLAARAKHQAALEAETAKQERILQRMLAAEAAEEEEQRKAMDLANSIEEMVAPAASPDLSNKTELLVAVADLDELNSWLERTNNP